MQSQVQALSIGAGSVTVISLITSCGYSDVHGLPDETLSMSRPWVLMT